MAAKGPRRLTLTRSRKSSAIAVEPKPPLLSQRSGRSTVAKKPRLRSTVAKSPLRQDTRVSLFTTPGKRSSSIFSLAMDIEENCAEDDETKHLTDTIVSAKAKLAALRTGSATTKLRTGSVEMFSARVRAEARLILASKERELTRRLRDQVRPLLENEIDRIKSCRLTPEKVKHRLIQLRKQVAERWVSLEVERMRVHEWNDAHLRQLAARQIRRLDNSMLLTGGSQIAGL